MRCARSITGLFSLPSCCGPNSAIVSLLHIQYSRHPVVGPYNIFIHVPIQIVHFHLSCINFVPFITHIPVWQIVFTPSKPNHIRVGFRLISGLCTAERPEGNVSLCLPIHIRSDSVSKLPIQLSSVTNISQWSDIQRLLYDTHSCYQDPMPQGLSKIYSHHCFFTLLSQPLSDTSKYGAPGALNFHLMSHCR